MSFLPLLDLVLVRRDLTPEREGSIIIPETARRRGREANVLAVGPGRITSKGKRIEPQVKTGDRVVLISADDAGPARAQYIDLEIEIEGEQGLTLVREDWIVGVIEP